jgi:hypothetical protein|eukprot:jgi/Chrpa1/24333/Chrysochromulina_OHIO_Genome00005381-RA
MGCLLPAIAYLGGVAIIASGLVSGAILCAYFLVAGTTWLVLAMIGYFVSGQSTNDGATARLVPPTPTG